MELALNWDNNLAGMLSFKYTNRTSPDKQVKLSIPPPGLSGFQESGNYLPENTPQINSYESKSNTKLLLLLGSKKVSYGACFLH